MVTLKDIAKEAGVSVMTVSNIVNGNYTKVSKETTEHVQKIISQMGYVPNASARSLAKSKTNIIAIIMRGEENENPMLNPYYSAMVGAMIRKIQQHGYYAMVNIMKSHQDILQSLRTWNVDGAIFLGLFDDEIEAMYSVCRWSLSTATATCVSFQISELTILRVGSLLQTILSLKAIAALHLSVLP